MSDSNLQKSEYWTRATRRLACSNHLRSLTRHRKVPGFSMSICDAGRPLHRRSRGRLLSGFRLHALQRYRLSSGRLLSATFGLCASPGASPSFQRRRVTKPDSWNRADTGPNQPERELKNLWTGFEPAVASVSGIVPHLSKLARHALTCSGSALNLAQQHRYLNSTLRCTPPKLGNAKGEPWCKHAWTVADPGCLCSGARRLPDPPTIAPDSQSSCPLRGQQIAHIDLDQHLADSGDQANNSRLLFRPHDHADKATERG